MSNTQTGHASSAERGDIEYRLRPPLLSESVFEVPGLRWPGEPGDVGAQYTARPGDTTVTVSERFSIDIDAMREANRNAPIDPSGALEPAEKYFMPGVTEKQIMIEEAVHAEFFASGVAREGIDEDELARACLDRSGWSIDLAYRRLEDVEGEKTAPVNRWDRIGDKVLSWLLFFFFSGLAVGLLALAQLVGRVIGDAYKGWTWVFILFVVLLGLTLVTVAVVLVLVGASEREDARVLRASRWAARRRDFDAAVRNFALDASIEELTRIHFADPADDVVHIDSSTLTTKAEAAQVVRTDTYRQIARQLARADGATLGLRGSRGAGKTDLVRSFCDQSVRQAEADPPTTFPFSPTMDEVSNSTTREDRVIGGFVAAPTSLDETAFLRRVALLVCDRTVERADERKISTTERDRWRLLAIGAAITAVGLVLAFGLHERVGASELGWLIALGGVAFLAVVWARSFTPLRRRNIRREKDPLDASEALLAEAVQEADALQRKLRQETTTSDAAEGSIGLRAASGKIARSVTTKDYQMSKDDIVEALSSIIRLLDAAGYRVILGIDELDRLEIDDDTAELLNAMKSLFAIPSCSCIVTISKSAWATFEQRGLRVRTVFDSSLDDIVEARPLSFLDARRLLRRRGADLSDSQVLFANVAAGGIARDTIRHTRVLADLSETSREDVTLSSAIRKFVEREAHSKVEAAILDIRGEGDVADSHAIIDELKEARLAFSQLTLEEFVALLPEATAESSRSSATRPDPAGYKESVRDRTLLYLAFLRLVEDAFSEGGPIAALTTDEPCRLVDLRHDALDAFNCLAETRDELGTGLKAGTKNLEYAAGLLRGIDPRRP